MSHPSGTGSERRVLAHRPGSNEAARSIGTTVHRQGEPKPARQAVTLSGIARHDPCSTHAMTSNHVSFDAVLTKGTVKPIESEKPTRSKKCDRIDGTGKPKPVKVPGGRAVDSLFRNTYRAQLDMLSLAAVKANIMISLNGLLMSVLIISGTHFISIDGPYLVPIVIMLVTCALATVFAVLASRPDISRTTYTRKDFDENRGHLLAFEEFSDLSEPEYLDAMKNMLGDRQRVYENMITHVHELGSTADRKYRHLYYSYSVFIGGIILAIGSLLALVWSRWAGLLPVV